MPRSPRVIVCSCEDITAGDIEHCIDKGFTDVESIKRYTGFGTGICQGRGCLHMVTRIMIACGVEEESIEPFTPRPPLTPVALGMLAEMEEDFPGTSDEVSNGRSSSSNSNDSAHSPERAGSTLSREDERGGTES